MPAPTEATEVLLLVHMPPLVVLLKVVVCPTQVVGTPVFAVRAGVTVATTVREQPNEFV